MRTSRPSTGSRSTWRRAPCSPFSARTARARRRQWKSSKASGARRELWALIRQLKKEGTTILLTTHYLDEAEQLADDVAIMNHGKIVARGSPAELIAQYGQGHSIVLAGAGEEGLKAVRARGVTAELQGVDVVVQVPLASDMRRMLEKLASIDTPLNEIYTRRASLEDVFLNLVGARMQEGVLAA